MSFPGTSSANGRDTEQCEGLKARRQPTVPHMVGATISVEVQDCGPLAPCVLSYHGELGLKFNLQVLHHAPQVGDLALAGLKLLRVAADLFPELSALQQPSG